LYSTIRQLVKYTGKLPVMYLQAGGLWYKKV